MKKFLMTLVALVCMAATASAQSVYVSTGDGAVAYHKNKSCSYLTNSKSVKSVTMAEAKKMGRHECTRCYGTAAPAKKVAPAKKAAPAAKKTNTPARDEKGRFVKKADTEKKAAEKKAKTEKKAAEKKVKTEKKAATKKAKTEKKATTPARDEKGRFIKKAA